MPKTRRSTAAVIVAALVTGILVAGTPTATANSSFESQFVSKINAERTKRGLSKLTVKSDLVSVARRHSARMAKKGDIWHNENLPNEVSGWQMLAENVGMGPSVDSLHTAFMKSDGHRANILHRSPNEIGVGVVVDKRGTIFVTEIFVQRVSSSSSPSKPASSGSGTVSTQASVTPVAAPAPAPKPKPKPKPKTRTITVLLEVVALDHGD